MKRRAPGCALLVLLMGGCGEGRTSTVHEPYQPSQPSVIAEENSQEGSPDWIIDELGDDPDLGAFVRPSTLSAGERIDVQVTARQTAQASWSVYRLGYYGGAGARHLATGGPVSVTPQPAPHIDAATGMVECRWPATFSIDTDDSWLSGAYLVRIDLAHGGARYAPFVIRDRRRADIVAVLPTATDQAYNAWGGESLYVDTRFGFPVGHAYVVSYDRPLADGAGGGFLTQTALPTARYLEANGYDVTYLADQDVNADELGRARLVLTLAHDEYWSKEARNGLEDARSQGISLAFLGANTGYWQVRYEDAWDGMPGRRMVGYKEAVNLDPELQHDPSRASGAFRGDILDRPENALLGVMSVDWHVIDFPWVVTNPGHWIYAGTGLAAGDLIPNLIGVESDAIIDNGHTPPRLSVVADSPTLGNDSGGLNRQQATVYETEAGGFVFATGSIRFASLLDGPRAQLEAQRMVRNLVARAGGAPLGEENPLGASSGFAAADLSRTARDVTTIAGVTGKAGFADGPAEQALFSSPMGLALAPDGWLIIADALNHRVRRLSLGADPMVETLAGSGEAGGSDGPSGQASFRTPWGVAVAPDGTVYVSDPRAANVRGISSNGVVRTLPVSSRLSHPTGIAVAADGTLYIVDSIDRRVHVVRPGGETGLFPFTHVPAGLLAFPTGIALDQRGGFWLLDSGNRALGHADAAGRLTILAGHSDGGFADGQGGDARFNPLLGLVFTGSRLILADTGSHRLRVVEPGGDAAATHVGTLAGDSRLSPDDGPGAEAGFVLPTGLAYDAANGVAYVSDTGHSTIRIVLP